MMKIGPISIDWRVKKDSSSDWLIDVTPQGLEEQYLFQNPDLLTNSQDMRNVLENSDYRQDINQKRRFAKFSYLISIPWAGLLITVVVLQGFAGGWQLGREEFIAVITATTGSVFGFAYVLGRYLFGSKAYRSHTVANDSVQTKE